MIYFFNPPFLCKYCSNAYCCNASDLFVEKYTENLFIHIFWRRHLWAQHPTAMSHQEVTQILPVRMVTKVIYTCMSKCTALPQYIGILVSSILASLFWYIRFLPGWSGAEIKSAYCAFCSVQTPHKLVLSGSAK